MLFSLTGRASKDPTAATAPASPLLLLGGGDLVDDPREHLQRLEDAVHRRRQRRAAQVDAVHGPRQVRDEPFPDQEAGKLTWVDYGAVGEPVLVVQHLAEEARESPDPAVLHLGLGEADRPREGRLELRHKGRDGLRGVVGGGQAVEEGLCKLGDGGNGGGRGVGERGGEEVVKDEGQHWHLLQISKGEGGGGMETDRLVYSINTLHKRHQ